MPEYTEIGLGIRWENGEKGFWRMMKQGTLERTFVGMIVPGAIIDCFLNLFEMLAGVGGRWSMGLEASGRTGDGESWGDPVLLFRKATEDGTAAGVDVVVEDETEEESSARRPVCCAHCGHEVTTLSERIEVSGAHSHSFANPHGYVFEVGCFNSAAGCRPAGPPSNEFTWFAGYNWRLALCGRCLSHLGWFFVSPGSPGFIALVLDRLVIPEA